VLLQDPAPTQADLSFSLFGIPVRINPMFWVMAMILGINASDRDLSLLFIWILAVFISILIHELGHAFAIRWLGSRPWITLYAMGGLTSHDPRRNLRSAATNTWEQILISFAGPGAGFLLVAVILGVLSAAGYRDKIHFEQFFGLVPQLENLGNFRVTVLLDFLFLISMLWGFFNLLPIYPLDGGQIARELWLYFYPRQGIPQSLMLSIVTASLVAFYQIFYVKSLFNGMLFCFFAYESYQILRAYSGRGRY
jgi:stage IV sporulation protein FB